MDDRRYRTLVLLTHPIQYSAPTLREMAKDPKIDLLTAYCSMQNVEPTLDPDFGVEVAWDIPLLEGYRWVQVPNQSFRPGLGRFLGLSNFGLWKLIRERRFRRLGHHDGLSICYPSGSRSRLRSRVEYPSCLVRTRISLLLGMGTLGRSS